MRHRPTAVELDELAGAWRAYLDDEAAFERLSDAIRVVLGRPENAQRRALREAKSVKLTDIPLSNRSFGMADNNGNRP